MAINHIIKIYDLFFINGFFFNNSFPEDILSHHTLLLIVMVLIDQGGSMSEWK